MAQELNSYQKAFPAFWGITLCWFAVLFDASAANKAVTHIETREAEKRGRGQRCRDLTQLVLRVLIERRVSGICEDSDH